MADPFISLIFLAGGKGLRMGSCTPKQYLPFLGKKLAWHSLDFFLKRKEIAEIIIVCEEKFQNHFPQNSKIIFASPGKRRQDSVFSALQKTDFTSELVIIHDSVRPFVNEKAFLQLVKMGLKYGAATLGSKVVHTIKEIDNGFVIKTLPKDRLYQVYTPQAALLDLLKKGFKMASEQTVTDDVSLIELLHMPVKIVEDDSFNVKITTPYDLKLAENYAQIQT